ncbi:MAG: response regulator [Geminocystis sp.]|nr:response regulator [Geminocystis sp.]MDW8115074.1 response regulator [Geminocystis sp.]MDW8464340.1 response regulator [Geminocystis sp.]
MVIDDQVEITRLIKLSLETTKKWNVVVANTWQQAVDILVNQRVDVILLDYLMPEYTGEEFLQKLRELSLIVETPVIFLTARSSLEFEWQKTGAKGIIAKPFNPISLGNTIAAILEGK